MLEIAFIIFGILAVIFFGICWSKEGEWLDVEIEAMIRPSDTNEKEGHKISRSYNPAFCGLLVSGIPFIVLLIFNCGEISLSAEKNDI